MSEPLRPSGGSLHRGLIGGGAVRWIAVEARGLAAELRERHALDRTAAALAAEGVVATLLMSAWIKGEERITLQIQGESPALSFVADADGQGGLRGRFFPPTLPVGHRAVSGMLLAIKSDRDKELYRSVARLHHQTLEAALSAHLSESDQVEAILHIGAELDEAGELTFVGGVLLERLPTDPSAPSISPAEFISTYGPLRAERAADLLTGIALGSLLGQPVELLESRELVWRCSCSLERVEAMLQGLGEAELVAMQEEDGQAEVICHFCNVAYVVDHARLGELIVSRHRAVTEA
jgi:molecular chaperone Hsp33